MPHPRVDPTVQKFFDRSLYDLYDSSGKRHVRRWLEKYGWTVEEHPDGKYGIDLKATKSGEVRYVEVEVRSLCWDAQHRFIHRTIHVPRRKRRYFEDDPARCWLFACEPAGFSAVIVPGEAIIESPVRKVPNIYEDEGRFYDVPVEKCEAVDLGGNE